jgi:hypothetical protein
MAYILRYERIAEKVSRHSFCFYKNFTIDVKRAGILGFTCICAEI